MKSNQSDQFSGSVPPTNVPGQAAGDTSSTPHRFGKWLVAGTVAIMLVGSFWFGPQVWQLAQDEEALEAWVAGLGWLGPIALIALNAIQIVVAPIPGYAVQLAAGFLYGPMWGGIWANVGLLIGTSVAFWLVRFYGRPLAGRLVGDERLNRWERVSHSDSTLVWFVLIISPIGDLPYFLAGLARVSFIKIFVITLIVRVPSTFVIAAAGAGVMWLNWWQITLVLVGLLGLLIVFLRYQERIIQWSDRHVQRRVDQSLGS